MSLLRKKQSKLSYRIFSIFILVSFVFTSVVPPSTSFAQVANMPSPGALLAPTPAFVPLMVKGMSIDPNNPLKFDFIVDTGDSGLKGQELKKESNKLIKYFLASLTVPEKDLWVNLSPYEKDRIIPEAFGVTEMGRDLLAQDYMLKQMSASLTNPDDDLGAKFWKRVHKSAFEKFGVTEIPMNTFNKVWIVPEKATVYQEDLSAYVIESKLKVMLEEDYTATQRNLSSEEYLVKSEEQEKAVIPAKAGIQVNGSPILHKAKLCIRTNPVQNFILRRAKTFGDDSVDSPGRLQSDIIREIIIPELEKEVNTGKSFASLRQMTNSMILATWYKQNLRESLLGKVYVDQNKTNGVEVADKNVKQKIYNQYLEAFNKGVYDYIREDYDPAKQSVVPRKYFSGGVDGAMYSSIVNTVAADRIGALPRDMAALASRTLSPSGPKSQFRVGCMVAENPTESAVALAEQAADNMMAGNKALNVKKSKDVRIFVPQHASQGVVAVFMDGADETIIDKIEKLLDVEIEAEKSYVQFSTSEEEQKDGYLVKLKIYVKEGFQGTVFLRRRNDAVEWLEIFVDNEHSDKLDEFKQAVLNAVGLQQTLLDLALTPITFEDAQSKVVGLELLTQNFFNTEVLMQMHVMSLLLTDEVSKIDSAYLSPYFEMPNSVDLKNVLVAYTLALFLKKENESFKDRFLGKDKISQLEQIRRAHKALLALVDLVEDVVEDIIYPSLKQLAQHDKTPEGERSPSKLMKRYFNNVQKRQLRSISLTIQNILGVGYGDHLDVGESHDGAKTGIENMNLTHIEYVLDQVMLLEAAEQDSMMARFLVPDEKNNDVVEALIRKPSETASSIAQKLGETTSKIDPIDSGSGDILVKVDIVFNNEWEGSVIYKKAGEKRIVEIFVEPEYAHKFDDFKQAVLQTLGLEDNMMAADAKTAKASRRVQIVRDWKKKLGFGDAPVKGPLKLSANKNVSQMIKAIVDKYAEYLESKIKKVKDNSNDYLTSEARELIETLGSQLKGSLPHLVFEAVGKMSDDEIDRHFSKILAWKNISYFSRSSQWDGEIWDVLDFWSDFTKVRGKKSILEKLKKEILEGNDENQMRFMLTFAQRVRRTLDSLLGNSREAANLNMNYLGESMGPPTYESRVVTAEESRKEMTNRLVTELSILALIMRAANEVKVDEINEVVMPVNSGKSFVSLLKDKQIDVTEEHQSIVDALKKSDDTEKSPLWTMLLDGGGDAESAAYFISDLRSRGVKMPPFVMGYLLASMWRKGTIDETSWLMGAIEGILSENNIKTTGRNFDLGVIEEIVEYVQERNSKLMPELEEEIAKAKKTNSPVRYLAKQTDSDIRGALAFVLARKYVMAVSKIDKWDEDFSQQHLFLTSLEELEGHEFWRVRKVGEWLGGDTAMLSESHENQDLRAGSDAEIQRVLDWPMWKGAEKEALETFLKGDTTALLDVEKELEHEGKSKFFFQKEFHVAWLVVRHHLSKDTLFTLVSGVTRLREVHDKHPELFKDASGRDIRKHEMARIASDAKILWDVYGLDKKISEEEIVVDGGELRNKKRDAVDKFSRSLRPDAWVASTAGDDVTNVESLVVRGSFLPANKVGLIGAYIRGEIGPLDAQERFLAESETITDADEAQRILDAAWLSAKYNLGEDSFHLLKNNITSIMDLAGRLTHVYPDLLLRREVRDVARDAFILYERLTLEQEIAQEDGVVEFSDDVAKSLSYVDMLTDSINQLKSQLANQKKPLWRASEKSLEIQRAAQWFVQQGLLASPSDMWIVQDFLEGDFNVALAQEALVEAEGSINDVGEAQRALDAIWLAVKFGLTQESFNLIRTDITHIRENQDRLRLINGEVGNFYSLVARAIALVERSRLDKEIVSLYHRLDNLTIDGTSADDSRKKYLMATIRAARKTRFDLGDKDMGSSSSNNNLPKNIDEENIHDFDNAMFVDTADNMLFGLLGRLNSAQIITRALVGGVTRDLFWNYKWDGNLKKIVKLLDLTGETEEENFAKTMAAWAIVRWPEAGVTDGFGSSGGTVFEENAVQEKAKEHLREVFSIGLKVGFKDRDSEAAIRNAAVAAEFMIRDGQKEAKDFVERVLSNKVNNDALSGDATLSSVLLADAVLSNKKYFEDDERRMAKDVLKLSVTNSIKEGGRDSYAARALAARYVLAWREEVKEFKKDKKLLRAARLHNRAYIFRKFPNMWRIEGLIEAEDFNAGLRGDFGMVADAHEQRRIALRDLIKEEYFTPLRLEEDEELDGEEGLKLLRALKSFKEYNFFDKEAAHAKLRKLLQGDQADNIEIFDDRFGRVISLDDALAMDSRRIVLHEIIYDDDDASIHYVLFDNWTMHLFGAIDDKKIFHGVHKTGHQNMEVVQEMSIDGEDVLEFSYSQESLALVRQLREKMDAKSASDGIEEPIVIGEIKNAEQAVNAVEAGANILVSSVYLTAEIIAAAKNKAKELNRPVIVISGVETMNEGRENRGQMAIWEDVKTAVSNGADGVKLKPFAKVTPGQEQNAESSIEGNVRAHAGVMKQAWEEFGKGFLIGGAGGIKAGNLAEVRRTVRGVDGENGLFFYGSGVDEVDDVKAMADAKEESDSAMTVSAKIAPKELIDLLSEDSSDNRTEAAQILKTKHLVYLNESANEGLKKQSVKALLKMLGGIYEKEREAAEGALAGLKVSKEDMAKGYIKALGEAGSVDARPHAANVLGEKYAEFLKDDANSGIKEEAVKALLELLDSVSIKTIKAAEGALAALEVSNAIMVKEYVKALNSKSPFAKKNSAMVLGEKYVAFLLNDENAKLKNEAIKELLNLLSGTLMEVIKAAEKALAELGVSEEVMVKEYVKVLKHGGSDEKEHTAKVLKEKYVEFLLKDENTTLREEVVENLRGLLTNAFKETVKAAEKALDAIIEGSFIKRIEKKEKIDDEDDLKMDLKKYIASEENSPELVKFVVAVFTKTLELATTADNHYDFYELAHQLNTRIVGIEMRAENLWVAAWPKNEGSYRWQEWTAELANDIAEDTIERIQDQMMVGRVIQQQDKALYGGIDLNVLHLDLQIKRDGRGIPLPVWDQPIETMNINGFFPIIIEITPVSLPLLLGFADQNNTDANTIPVDYSNGLDPMREEELFVLKS